MPATPNRRIFRTFYANDWNQSEQSLKHLLTHHFHQKSHQLFPRMRKKCVKQGQKEINQNNSAIERTDESNGFTILFPYFPKCFKIQN